jgi:L-lactate dehydrogenase
MKIGIVGAGQVGATAAYAMTMRGVGSEIVLVDRKADLAVADERGFATLAWYYQQIRRMGRGEAPDLRLSVLRAFLAEQRDDARIRRKERAS